MSAQAREVANISREVFESLKNRVFSGRRSGEHFLVSLSGEESHFVRINGAKIRQLGTVEDASFEVTLILESSEGLRKSARSCTVTGLAWQDQESVDELLAALRRDTPLLPVDPFAELPCSGESSSESKKGNLLDRELAPESLIAPARSMDLAGIYASGRLLRAMASTAGVNHWFETDTFSFDYSIYTPNQRAIKGTYAGTEWNGAEYARALETARERTGLLEIPARRVARGEYRTYLAPAAVADLVMMFSWGCLGEAPIRQGDSPLRLVRSGERGFSPKVSLSEDFSTSLSPRFNGPGELAPRSLPLIERGSFVSSLVSSRSAKEYGVSSNGASAGEFLRSASLAGGALKEEQILSKLGTGLYLSNLHYLNWSDQARGRITGMTRYACFWVENGKIVSPIENMRWDESLFEVFGGSLEEFTAKREVMPEVGTYERRGIGGHVVPGALLSRMGFTL